MEKDLQHSINYINQKTRGKTGFSVPKGYFEDVDNEVFCKLFEEQKTERKSFETPKDYFLNIEDEILAKISSEEKTHHKKEIKVISLKKLIPFVAAASILLFTSVYFLKNSVNSNSLDVITVAEIEDWYENEYSTTDINELTMIFDETDFSDLEVSSISFEEQDLQDYFNSVETNDLINE